MQEASLSRPEEVTMLTRRILACACALALAVPAVAGARAGFDPPPTTHHVVYGDTKYDQQNQQDQGSSKGDVANVYVAPKGDTKDDLAAPATGAADATAALTAEQLAAAYGGTGPLHPAPVTHRVVVPAGKSVGGRLVAVRHNPVAGSSDDGVNGWQIAAVAEAGLLAALLLGSAVFVGRIRPSGTAHA
jgi:hypothetical protein